LAVASPIPLFPPVTTATLPSSRFMRASARLGFEFIVSVPEHLHTSAGGLRQLDECLNYWSQEILSPVYPSESALRERSSLN